MTWGPAQAYDPGAPRAEQLGLLEALYGAVRCKPAVVLVDTELRAMDELF